MKFWHTGTGGTFLEILKIPNSQIQKLKFLEKDSVKIALNYHYDPFPSEKKEVAK